MRRWGENDSEGGILGCCVGFEFKVMIVVTGQVSLTINESVPRGLEKEAFSMENKNAARMPPR